MPGPYTQYTLTSLTTEISNLLDDTSNKYWTVLEIQYAIQEAMYVWGALTAYWRSNGTFNTAVGTAYYDLSVQMPTLRTRTWTLGQLCADIQYALLEAANGIAGTGMSGQTTVTAILNAINRARNKFVLDAVLPFSIATTTVASPPASGVVQFSNTTEYLHRAAWQDTASGTWYSLWRQDNYAADAGLNNWLGGATIPRAFSQSNQTPLELQLIPPAAAAGVLETISASSLMLNLTSAATTFNVPDEWIHAIKWGAIAELVSVQSQLADPVRSQYATSRYNQAVDYAKLLNRSIVRAVYNNTPLMIDTLFNVDAGQPVWRNQIGPPQTAGILYDILAVVPGSPDAVYTLSVDVIQAAPIPLVGTDTIDVGPEDIPHLIDYAMHILTFKCGGRDFESTFGRYNNFMDAVSFRGQINKAQIQYIKPSLDQPSMEEGERPDVYQLQTTRRGQ